MSTTSRYTYSTSSFESPYVSLDLLAYLNSGKITPFHTFKDVVIPELQCHLSKVKKSLPHPPQKDEARDTINGKNEEDNSNCDDDLDPHVIFDDIQSDLNSINKACRELKLWADRVNQEIQALILQGLDDAFKARTEALEISLRIEQLRRTKEVVSMLKKQICSSPQLSPDSLQSESLPHSRFSMRTDFLPESPGQKPEENINQMFIKSLTLIEFEEKYKGLDDTQKKCLLCFSVFPENETIKKKVLIHWWVGEGFIDGKTAEETGNKYFKDFIDKGIIERVHKKRRKNSENCKMKPSIRDTIIKLAEEDGFVSFDSKGNPTADFSSCPRVCLVKTEDGSSLRDFTYIYHYLEHEKIRTLFNVNEPQLNFRVGRFSKMKNLKVLQLGRWRASARQLVEVEGTEFLQGMKKMKQLRYFSLRGISRITELPNSICELSNLRILNLNGCDNLEKLPDGIGSLKQLTHLDMSECYLISHMPKGLASLSELRVLKGFVIGKPRSRGHYCELADLAELEQLKKLSIHVDRTSDEAKKELDSLPQFRNLRSLSVAWSSIYNAPIPTTTNVALATFLRNVSREKSIKTPGSSSHHAALDKLGLQNFHGSKMPDWLKRLNLKNLKKLYIRGGELSDLRLMKDYKWTVKCLRLKSLSQLRMDWQELQPLFPNLAYVEKVECPELSSFPCDQNGEWIHPEADTEQA
ncbi:disease resistance RPP13-like protein 4 [Quercus lobata]|uniref:Disease resistance RPP13-like protein 4 n=1 Tax=Quercus lobata TaxID=97700 RepID=A0A7N2LSJ3_QUELO|nr:disease resistance RPP13-like protein 4 [Quercus lobata]